MIIGVAVHTETREEMVVYKQLYDSPGFPENSLWVRPRSMFEEEIEINGKKLKRFVYVGNK